MTSKGFKIRHVTFTGTSKKAARLDFSDGLNIIYGASNTGKTFTVKALDFMFGGGTAPPQTEKTKGYEALLMGLTLPDGRDITLYRALQGGGFQLFEGLLFERPKSEGRILNEKHNAKSDDNLSTFLLSILALTGKKVVKSALGQKENVTFRSLSRFLFVEEDAIISERSPIYSGQKPKETLEKNVFKVLLTGTDDASVVQTKDPKIVKAATQGKKELIDEMIVLLDEEIGENSQSRTDLEDQREKLKQSLTVLQKDVAARQQGIDNLTAKRRDLFEQLSDAVARRNELELTLRRFAKLDEVYASDLERLEALEEGGFILMAHMGKDCPVCGALPKDQKHAQEIGHVNDAHRAAKAEIAKILRERADLNTVVASLKAETTGLQQRVTALKVEQVTVEKELAELRPAEANSRLEYERLLATREQNSHRLSLIDRRDRLLETKSQLEPASTKKSNAKISVGVDGTTAHQFEMTVQKVLEAWHFPGFPKVTFDHDLQDIRVNGQPRSANGKGVRAVLHAAFKVGVLLYCFENKLPHPGFVVLDTPLLTYREPLHSKYGDLTADELAIKQSPLEEYFYLHLASLADRGQFIVLENDDPPAAIAGKANITVFTGEEGNERFGLFP